MARRALVRQPPGQLRYSVRVLAKKPTKKKRSPRSRTIERERERGQEKLLAARQRLAQLEPGGSPERPLEVGSASVVELRAEADPCLRCGAATRTEEHGAVHTPSGLLRAVKVRCRACGQTRDFFLRILEDRLN